MRVLLLTGTCGSGKSTIARLLGARPGWAHISEDAIWAAEYGLSRGAFGSTEYLAKRSHIQQQVFEQLNGFREVGINVAVDVTLHESPPEGFDVYRLFLASRGVTWAVRVLHPSLDVAVARDACRSRRPLGRERIAALRGKFTGRVFQPEWFMDNSVDTTEETVGRLIREGVA
jgi:chloramphenicol 3-O-phosphotransferase